MNKQISYIFNSKALNILAFIFVFVSVTVLIFSDVVIDNRDSKLKNTLSFFDENIDNEYDVMFFSNSYLYTAYDPL